MPASTGTHIGPYEILSQIGAGGMGEVYRARDSRLGRDVALKLLPSGFAADPDRLRRFEQEARAAGALNHPNITAVFDFGSDSDVYYAASELLEGDTLRARIAEGIPPRRAIEYAIQLARGLAAAHARGIVHRDLKPENVFVTSDGVVKILDFGLAKQLAVAGGSNTQAPTNVLETNPGTVMGTAGYMSPEQVRGSAADHRSDIFSFGAILYEMLTGQQAFGGETSVETMTAILREDPPPMAGAQFPPVLESVVRHCLEKRPEDRFQSARDLAFQLEAISHISSGSGSSDARIAAAQAPATAARWIVPAAAVAAALTLAFAAFLFGRQSAVRHLPSYLQMTFRRGVVDSARFAPTGDIVYSARWDGGPSKIYAIQGGMADSPVNLSDGLLLAISKTGEMAVQRFTDSGEGFISRVPAGGGSFRDVVRGRGEAQWGPDGDSLLVVTYAGPKAHVEYPRGTTLREDYGTLMYRLSPDGKRLAWIRAGARMSLEMMDLATKSPRVLVKDWVDLGRYAWKPSGEGLLFVGQRNDDGDWSLASVDTRGNVSELDRSPLPIAVEDIDRQGRVLYQHSDERYSMILNRNATDTDYSWLSGSQVSAIAPDGGTVLFTETGGARPTTYIRVCSQSAAVKLAEGWAAGLSRDGRFALVIDHDDARKVTSVPTGAGDPHLLPQHGILVARGFWSPDGRFVLLAGSDASANAHTWLQPMNDGAPQGAGRLLTSDEVRATAISPDGKWASAGSPGAGWKLYPTAEGASRPLAGVENGEIPVSFSADGRYIYAVHKQTAPPTITLTRVDIASGARSTWKTLKPADPAGIVLIGNVALTPDGETVAFTTAQSLSELFLVTGLQ